jgi:hypothetical protein
LSGPFSMKVTLILGSAFSGGVMESLAPPGVHVPSRSRTPCTGAGNGSVCTGLGTRMPVSPLVIS